jgi:hypothetical protein
MNSYSPGNRLLLAVPPRGLKELIADPELLRCQSQEILLDADSSLGHVFFPEAGSSRWWQFMPMATLSRWQRLAGKAAPECRPFSVPRFHRRGSKVYLGR